MVVANNCEQAKKMLGILTQKMTLFLTCESVFEFCLDHPLEKKHVQGSGFVFETNHGQCIHSFSCLLLRKRLDKIDALGALFLL